MNEMASIFWALLYVRVFINNSIYKAVTGDDKAPPNYDVPYNTVAGIILILGLILAAAGSLVIAFKSPWLVILIVLGILLITIALTMFTLVLLIDFTELGESHAQAVMQGSGFHRFIFWKEDHILDESHNLIRVIDEDPVTHQKVALLPERLPEYEWPKRYVLKGLRWYFKPTENIYERTWSWVAAAKTGDGIVLRKDEVARSFKVGQRYPFGLDIRDERFVDINGTPILLRLTLHAQNTNPYKMWFDETDWFPVFIGDIISALGDWIQGVDYDKITKSKTREPKRDIWEWIQGREAVLVSGADGTPDMDVTGYRDRPGARNLRQKFNDLFAVDLVDISINEFIQSAAYREAQAEKYRAEREAEATLAKAKGFAGFFNQLAMARFGINPASANSLQELQAKLADPIFVRRNKDGINWVQKSAGWQQAIIAGVFRLNAIEGLQPGGVGLEPAIALFKSLGGDLSGGEAPTQGGRGATTVGGGQQSRGQSGGTGKAGNAKNKNRSNKDDDDDDEPLF